MKAFLNKELNLAVPKPLFLFCVLGFMTVIPNYPGFVGVMYSVIAIFILYGIHKENRDLEFSAILPVSRNNIVRTKFVVAALFQWLTFLAAAVGAIISALWVSPNGNIVGIDANAAFFGIALIAFSVFNIVFFPWHFRTGYKVGLPVIIAITLFLLVYGIFETIINVEPTLKIAIDTLDSAYLGWQLLVLAVGLVTYAITFFIAYKMSCKRFRQANL